MVICVPWGDIFILGENCIEKRKREKQERKSESQPTWADIEVALATEIVEESKKKSRKWFTAWIVTAAAQVASNLAWILGGIEK